RRAPDEVDHPGLALARRPEPQRPLLARLQSAVATEAVVAAVRLVVAQLDVLAGAVAVVRLAGRVEPGGGLGVGARVVGLEVRSLVAARLDADPGQRRDDALDPLRPVARGVGVLD